MAQLAKTNDSTGSSKYQKIAWNTTAADYNILENGPGGSAGCDEGYCCRALLVVSPAGALVYVDASGNTVTVPQAMLLEKPYMVVQAKALVAAGSGNAIVKVYW
jgi:hypothetical protein